MIELPIESIPEEIIAEALRYYNEVDFSYYGIGHNSHTVTRKSLYRRYKPLDEVTMTIDHATFMPTIATPDTHSICTSYCLWINELTSQLAQIRNIFTSDVLIPIVNSRTSIIEK